MIVEVSSFLPFPIQACVVRVSSPRLLQYVAAPMVQFDPVEPLSFPEQWEERDYLVRVTLFGFIPFGKQTISISVPTNTPDLIELRDNGHSKLIRKWDHRILLHPVEGGTHYTDRVEIEAGILTPFIWAFASVFYRHRQRRWRKLIKAKFVYSNA